MAVEAESEMHTQCPLFGMMPAAAGDTRDG